MFAVGRSIGVLACAFVNVTGVSAGLGAALSQRGIGVIDVKEEQETGQQWHAFDRRKLEDSSVTSLLDPERDVQMRKYLEVLEPKKESTTSNAVFSLLESIFDYEYDRKPFPVTPDEFEPLIKKVKEVSRFAISAAEGVCGVLESVNNIIVTPFTVVVEAVFDAINFIINGTSADVDRICGDLVDHSEGVSDPPTLSPTKDPSSQPSSLPQSKVVYPNSTLAKEKFKYDTLIELPLGEDFLFMRDDEIVGLLLQSEAGDILADYVESLTGKSEADLTPQELEVRKNFLGRLTRAVIEKLPIDIMKKLTQIFCQMGLRAIAATRDIALESIGLAGMKPLFAAAVNQVKQGFLEFAYLFDNTVSLLCSRATDQSFIMVASALDTAIWGTLDNFTNIGVNDDTVYFGRKNVCAPITKSFSTVKKLQTNINHFKTGISTFAYAAFECGGGIEALGLGSLCSIISTVITEVSYVGNLVADGSMKVADTYASMQNSSLYYDMCTCFARDNKLLRGSGCDNIDQNCDGDIDDCDEDQIPPEIYLVQPIPVTPFLSFEDAEAFLTENILVSDDCAGDLIKTVEIIRGDGRNNLEFQVTVFHPRCDQTFIYAKNSTAAFLRQPRSLPPLSPSDAAVAARPPPFQLRVAIDEEAPTVASGWYIPQNPSFDNEFAFLAHSSKSSKTSSSSKCFKSKHVAWSKAAGSERAHSLDDDMNLPPSIISTYQDPLEDPLEDPLAHALSLQPLLDVGGRQAPSPSFDSYKRASKSSKSLKLSQLRYPRDGEILAVDSKFFNTKFVDINFWYQLGDDNVDGTLDVTVEVQSNQLTEDERHMARVYLLKTGTLTKVGVNLALECCDDSIHQFCQMEESVTRRFYDVSVTAKDNAGNEVTTTRTVAVLTDETDLSECNDASKNYEDLEDEYEMSVLRFVLTSQSFSINMSDPLSTEKTKQEPDKIGFPKEHQGVQFGV